jgi:hypothetical protein
MAKIDARFEGLMESDALLTKRSDERYAAVVERIGPKPGARGPMVLTGC